MTSYLVSASIVAFHSSPDELKKAIASFLNNNFSKLLVVIDHSIHDGLREMVSAFGEEVVYFHHPENKGFGAGHNIAIQKIQGQSTYHLILNPDVYFDQSVLPSLTAYMDAKEQVGAMMPKILDQNGNLQYLAKLLPTPSDLLFKRFLPQNLAEQRLIRFQLKFTDYNSIMNVPYLSGCFMFLRTKALAVSGLFDERFFMYPEDIDLSRRIHEHYETLYYPHVFITHKHEAASYRNYKMLWIHIKNMVKYFNKWGWFKDKKRKEINFSTLNKLGYFES
jgi:GT2 family glycosyltransferase